MPKYIDADALKVVMVFSQKLGDLTVPEMRDILTEIDSIPAAYVVEVVYCSECVYHYDDGNHKCKKLRIPCPDDSEFFCKYGKKKKR